MNDMQVTVELDTNSLKQVQKLAKDQKRTLEDEAACLLEKGITITETEETQKQEGIT